MLRLKEHDQSSQNKFCPTDRRDPNNFTENQGLRLKMLPNSLLCVIIASTRGLSRTSGLSQSVRSFFIFSFTLFHAMSLVLRRRNDTEKNTSLSFNFQTKFRWWRTAELAPHSNEKCSSSPVFGTRHLGDLGHANCVRLTSPGGEAAGS